MHDNPVINEPKTVTPAGAAEDIVPPLPGWSHPANPATSALLPES